MASRFVETDEDFIEELRNTSEIYFVKTLKKRFVKTLKIRVKLILNCPQAHAITYTKQMDRELQVKVNGCVLKV